MILVFDLDDTLIKNKYFKEDLFDLYRDLGFTKKLAREDYMAHRSEQLFSPFEQFLRLKKQAQSEISLAKFTKLFDERFGDFSKYLVPGTKQVLRRLRGKHVLYLVTYGDKKFQERKCASLKQYFDTMFFTEGDKLPEVKKILSKHSHERVVFIDDKRKYLKSVQETYPHIFTIQARMKSCFSTKLNGMYKQCQAAAYTMRDIEKIVSQDATKLVPRYKYSEWTLKKMTNLATTLLQQDEVICLPTETSYGFCTDVTRGSRGMKSLAWLKPRQPGKIPPLIVRDFAMVRRYAHVSQKQAALLKRHEDDVVTFGLMAKKEMLDPGVLLHGEASFRKATQPLLRNVAQKYKKPFSATSANNTGKPPVFSFHGYQNQFRGKDRQVAAFFDYGKLKEAPPSTIVSLTGDAPKIVRQGKTKILDAK